MFRTYSSIWSLPIPAAGPAVAAAPGTPLTTGRQTIESVEVSTDGQWLVFDSDRGGNADLYRMPAVGGEPVWITSDSGGDFSAVWSRDGRHIAFRSVRGGLRHVYTVNAGGSGLVQQTVGQASELDPTWSLERHRAGFPVNPERPEHPPEVSLSGKDSSWVVATSGDFLRWSPTGAWLTYHGGDAFFSAWAPHGNTIYYLSRRPTGWAIRSVPFAGDHSGAGRLRRPGESAGPVRILDRRAAVLPDHGEQRERSVGHAVERTVRGPLGGDIATAC